MYLGLATAGKAEVPSEDIQSENAEPEPEQAELVRKPQAAGPDGR